MEEYVKYYYIVKLIDTWLNTENMIFSDSSIICITEMILNTLAYILGQAQALVSMLRHQAELICSFKQPLSPGKTIVVLQVPYH